MTPLFPFPDVFDLFRPADPGPLVLDSPHSGSVYPDDFGHVCPLPDLYAVEDSYVHEIFSGAPGVGAALLCARFPRSYIDVNRSIDDLDPLLLETNRIGPCDPSFRSAGGYGLIRRLVRAGVSMYDRRLSDMEIKTRIEGYYNPYHNALKGLVEDSCSRFGRVWHLNCHSMPAPERGGGPDIVLGDRDGTSCGPAFRETVREALTRMGYRVTLNDPYKGVEILRRYGAPARNRHSLQIELAKRLYMDEKTGEKTKGFNRLHDDMTTLVRICHEAVRGLDLCLAAD